MSTSEEKAPQTPVLPNKLLPFLADNGLILLFCILSVSLPLLYVRPAYDAAGVPREMLLALAAGLAICLYAWQCNRAMSPQSGHPVFLFMLLLLGWAVASLYWSVDRGSTLLGITQFASLIILGLLASRLHRQLVQRYLLPVTLIAAILVALIGIGQHFGFNPLALRQFAPPAATFTSKNYAANYFDLITPVALALLLIQPRPSKPLAILAATAFTGSLAYLVISQTRGSWLGLLVAAVVLSIICFMNQSFRSLFFQSVQRHQRALLVALLVVTALGFTESRVLPDDNKLAKMLSLTPDMSTNIRLALYQNALAGFADRPLVGVGYGAFISGFTPFLNAVSPLDFINQNTIIPYLHSDPLQMFFELGLPGGILALAIYIILIILGCRIIIAKTDASLRILGLGFTLALLASGAHAWVDFPLRLPTSAFFFWVWAGIIIGLHQHIYSGRTLTLSRLTLAITGVVGLVFSVHSMILYTNYLGANIDVRNAHFHVLKQDCKSAFELTDRAMDQFGFDHLTRFWYAKVYTYCEAPSNTKLRAMDRVLRYDVNMPLPYLTRAEIQLKDGYIQGAVADFNRYRKLLPHRPEGYHGLGLASLRLHNVEQAIYWLEQASIRAPENNDLSSLLTRLTRRNE